MRVEEILDKEVTALAGGRDARKGTLVGGRRHGSTPDHRAGRPARADSRAADSSCRLERVAAAIVGGAAWRSRGQRVVVDARAVGGCRAATTRRQPRRFLARSDCRGRRCRVFIQASATKLRELQERTYPGKMRSLSYWTGKTCAASTMVVALNAARKSIESMPPLAGDHTPGYRATPAEGDGRPSLAHASGHAQACA